MLSRAARTITQQVHQHSRSHYRNAYQPQFISSLALFAAISSAVTLSFAESNVTDNDQVQRPVYRRDEVSLHTTKDKGIWVYYKDGVYDITKFVASHPGGKDKILLAAGKDIQPFWNVYRQHYNSKLPMELLEEMRIGDLHPDDVLAAAKTADNSDPYRGDPVLSPLMTYIQRKPINAEPPNFILTDNWVTETDAWFVRNHHPVPLIDEKDFRLTLDVSAGLTGAKRGQKAATTYTLEDLKTQFPQHSVVATLQCGGNRRAEMNRRMTTLGSQWSVGAICNGRYSGVLLRDLLLRAGVTDDSLDERANPGSAVKHVVFVGEDGLEVSIPARKAMDRYGDVLLAHEMNGQPLPPEHGYPLRAVVPGHAGVRNAKWLKEVRLSSEEARGPWQRGIAYKGFGPSVLDPGGIDVEAIPSLQEPPVQSAITLPRPDSKVAAGEPVTVQGYAYSGGGRGIVRVDVSADGGRTWKTADLTAGSEQPLDRAWGWTFWECDVDLPKLPVDSQHPRVSTAEAVSRVGMEISLVCKATDASYNVQPDSVDGIWNLRGINNNAWHRVTVQVVHPDELAAEDDE